MREAKRPKEGFYAFRSKEDPDDCSFVVYPAVGMKVEDFYDEITEAEYEEIKKAVEEKAQNKRRPLRNREAK